MGHPPFVSASSVTAAQSYENSIPVIDVGPLVSESASNPEKLAVAKEIGEACENVGFFAIQNHGVDRKVIEKAWNETGNFFDLPVDVKVGEDGFLLMTDSFPYGYSPFGGEVLGKGDELGLSLIHI